MKLDAKVKGGLAWAGLVVILAVPSADLIFGKPDAAANSVKPAALPTLPTTTTDTDAGKPVADVKPVAKPGKLTVPTADPVQTASTGDAVDDFVKSGKKMPSYISDGEQVASTPDAPAKVKTPTTTTTEPEQTASTTPVNPPYPTPRNLRPKSTSVAALPAEEPALILDENRVIDQEQDQASIEPFPMSDGTDGSVITGDQLDEWDSGSLADYLERKGLLSGSTVKVETQTAQPSDEFDDDGFFLDEGPNNEPRRRIIRREPDFFLF